MKKQILLFLSLFFSVIMYGGMPSNNALSFDGTDDYVDMGTVNPTANFSTTGFSYTGWVKWNSFKSWSRLLDLGTATAGVGNIVIANNLTSNSLNLTIYNDWVNRNINTGTILVTNTWTYIAVTISTTGVGKIYINGAEVSTTSAGSGTLLPVNYDRSYCYLAKSSAVQDGYFDGSMDNVGIWNKELSAAEITTYMNTTLTGTETGLYNAYNFNQGTAGGDNTGINTLTNSVTATRNGALKNFTLTGTTSNWVAQASTAIIVTNPGNTTPNLATSYSSLASAITALNSITAMSGPVVFNIAANYTETAPVGGYKIGNTVLNPLTSATNTITFKKSGTGANPLITASTGTGTTDGIIKVAGCDYVSLSDIDLQENIANTTAITQMEWGFAILKQSATDGSQNISITNCSVTLNKANTASIGIYGGNHIADDNSPLTIASTTGTNANIKINGCQIANCYIPISIYGFPTNSSYYDTGLEIGSTAGNTLSNFGGGSLTTYGIYINGQMAPKIENNNITLGLGTNNQVNGIYVYSMVLGDLLINANTISISSSSTTGSNRGILNLAPIATKLNITNNIIQNCDFTAATTAIFSGIQDGASTTGCIVNITGNTISDINYSSNTLTGSGGISGISKAAGAATTVNINSNTIRNIKRYGTTGGYTYAINFAAGVNQTANNNTIHDISINGTGTSAQIVGISPATNGVLTINNNTIYNLSIAKTTATQSIYGIANANASTSITMNNNTIYGLSNAGVSANCRAMGIGSWYCTNAQTYSNNLIYELTTKGSGYSEAFEMQNGNISLFKNKIHSIYSLGDGGSIGMALYDATCNVYNNYIGNLYAPVANASDAIEGIYCSSTVASTGFNLYNNTIYLDATSTGTNFGSSGIYHAYNATATIGTLDMRNNIVINKSIATGTGVTCAFERDIATDLNNLATTCNNNLFYAGTPSAHNAIYYDGTNVYQTLADYKTAVGPTRETASVTENPTFVNTNSADANFLHINTTVPTLIEGNGQPIAMVTDDFDGDVRNASTPDIGADEGNFTKGVYTDIAPISVSDNVTIMRSNENQIKVILTGSENYKGDICVYNTLGQTMSSKTINGAVTLLDGNLKKGIYVVTVNVNGKNISKNVYLN